MVSRSVLLIASLALAAPLLAQAQEEEQQSPWAGKATLGYLATSGNSDTTSLNSGFEVGYTSGNWAHLLTLGAINATQDDVTTAEAYNASWKSERNLSENNFLFGRLDWRKDLFSAYDSQFSQTVGYGRRLIDSDKHKLNATIGAGLRQSDLIDGTSEDETIFRGGMDYVWTLSETAEFTQDIIVEAGEENTYLESVTAISAKLVGNLALVASYTIKNNSEVLPGVDDTDTFTALSLEYLF